MAKHEKQPKKRIQVSSGGWPIKMNVKNVRLIGDCSLQVYPPKEPVWIAPEEDRKRLS
jgi:hypothetical protein